MLGMVYYRSAGRKTLIVLGLMRALAKQRWATNQSKPPRTPLSPELAVCTGAGGVAAKSIQVPGIAGAAGPALPADVLPGMSAFLPWISFAATGVSLPPVEAYHARILSWPPTEAFAGTERVCNPRNPSTLKFMSSRKASGGMIGALYEYVTLDPTPSVNGENKIPDQWTYDGLNGLYAYFEMQNPSVKHKSTLISCTKKTFDADALLKFARLSGH